MIWNLFLLVQRGVAQISNTEHQISGHHAGLRGFRKGDPGLKKGRPPPSQPLTRGGYTGLEENQS